MSYTPAVNLSATKIRRITEAFNKYLVSCDSGDRYVRDVLTELEGAFGVHLPVGVALTTLEHNLLPKRETNSHVMTWLLKNGYPAGLIASTLESLATRCRGGGLSLLRHAALNLYGANRRQLPDLQFLLKKVAGRVKQEAKDATEEELPVLEDISETLEESARQKNRVDIMGLAIQDYEDAAEDINRKVDAIPDEGTRKSIKQALLQLMSRHAALTLVMQAVGVGAGALGKATTVLTGLVADVVSTGATGSREEKSSEGSSAGGRYASAGGVTDLMARAALAGGRHAVRQFGGRSGRTGFGMAADALSVAALAGDVKMLALLDALDVDLSQHERMQVSNAYARTSRSGTSFRRDVYESLGLRGLQALVDVGLLDEDDLPSGNTHSEPHDGGVSESSGDSGSSVSSGESVPGGESGSGSGSESDSAGLHSGESVDTLPSDAGASPSSMGGRSWGSDAIRRAAALAVPY